MLTVLAAVAALAAGAAKMEYGDSVTFPSSLSSAGVGSLGDRYGIPLNGSTYRAICALGDRSVERMQASSRHGYSPLSPKLTCMSESGWEVPRAEQHSRLYELAYAWMTNTTEHEIESGVKAYPPILFAGFQNGALGTTWQWANSMDADAVKVDVNKMNLNSGVGNIFGSEPYGQILQDLYDAVSLKNLSSTSLDISGASSSARTVLWNSLSVMGAITESEFAVSNFIERGGITSGSPLRSIDPYACHILLEGIKTTPVIANSLLLGTIQERVTETDYTNVITISSIRSALTALGTSGLSGDLTVYPSSTTTDVEITNGLKVAYGISKNVTENYSFESPNVSVYLRVRADTSTIKSGWQVVGTYRSEKRYGEDETSEDGYEGSTSATIILERMTITNLESYTVLSVGAHGSDFKRIKKLERTRTDWTATTARERVFPTDSSYESSGEDMTYGFFKYTNTKDAQSEINSTRDPIDTDYVGVWSMGSFGFHDNAWSMLSSAWNGISLDKGDSYTPSFTTVGVRFTVPDLSDSVSGTEEYRTRVIPDDPTKWYGDGTEVVTNYFQYVYESDEFDDGDFTIPASGIPEGVNPSDVSHVDPTKTNPYTFNVPCNTVVNGQGEQYLYRDLNSFSTPTFIGFITLNYR